MQVQVARADGSFDVGDHVLYVACREGEVVPGRALTEQVSYEEGRVDTLVPGPASGHYKLAR